MSATGFFFGGISVFWIALIYLFCPEVRAYFPRWPSTFLLTLFRFARPKVEPPTRLTNCSTTRFLLGGLHLISSRRTLVPHSKPRARWSEVYPRGFVVITGGWKLCSMAVNLGLDCCKSKGQVRLLYIEYYLLCMPEGFKSSFAALDPFGARSEGGKAFQYFLGEHTISSPPAYRLPQDNQMSHEAAEEFYAITKRL